MQEKIWTNRLPHRSERWRHRLQRIRAGVRRVVPFASGVLAALVALLLYNALMPAPQPLTTREVKDTVAQAMASATPPPAYSERVYQIIRPSLILIQTRGEDAEGEEARGLGSGVIINDNGDILTALHVVTNSTVITVTFADGTRSRAQLIAAIPRDRHGPAQRQSTARADRARPFWEIRARCKSAMRLSQWAIPSACMAR